MNIQIKSRQVYDTHQEETVTKHEATLTQEGEVVTLTYDGGKVEIHEDEKLALVQTGKNLIKIQINEKNLLNYNTEYGTIPIEVVGESIMIKPSPLAIELRYQITFNQGISYQNVIEITEE